MRRTNHTGTVVPVFRTADSSEFVFARLARIVRKKVEESYIGLDEMFLRPVRAACVTGYKRAREGVGS
jgi:hypothetical protein